MKKILITIAVVGALLVPVATASAAQTAPLSPATTATSAAFYRINYPHVMARLMTAYLNKTPGFSGVRVKAATHRSITLVGSYSGYRFTATVRKTSRTKGRITVNIAGVVQSMPVNFGYNI